MRRTGQGDLGGAFPRPGPALRGVLGGVLLLWLAFALSINWGPDAVADAAQRLFLLGTGSSSTLPSGQLWRLVTASLLHSPQGLGHIFFGLLGLYFLGASLEAAWGARRFLLFLLGASVAGYGLQALLLLLLPTSAASRLVPPIWLGTVPMIGAIAIAWATSFRGQEVRLFFLIPVSSRGLVLFVVGASALATVAADMPSSGLLAPFGGMLAGWLLGGEPMTVRRWWLRWRLRAHERALAEVERRRRSRAAASGLRVIRGGRAADETDGSDPEEPTGGEPPVLH